MQKYKYIYVQEKIKQILKKSLLTFR